MASASLLADPKRAWEPYEPDAAAPWNFKRAMHLFRRTEFGAPKPTVERALRESPSAVVQRLVAQAQEASDQDQFDQLDASIVPSGSTDSLAAAWLYRMLFTQTPLREVMTIHWHSHFATSDAKVRNTSMMHHQVALLRGQALGSFRDMVHGIARDPAMLIYLDSATNRKSHPNENFARELLELFCLGEGNYTEADIKELARCFTGWEVRDERFRINRFQHDPSEKRLFGVVDRFDGDAAIDVVLQQPIAASFIASKLIQWFVCDEPAPSPELSAPVAQWLVEHDWQLAPVVQRILQSRLFFSDESIARKIRSPIGLAIGLLRTLEAKTDTTLLARTLHRIGHGVYYPPNVKGWEGGRRWIDSAALLSRTNLVRQLLASDVTQCAGKPLVSWLQSQSVLDAERLVAFCEEQLCALPLPTVARSSLLELAQYHAADPGRQAIEVITALSTLPEFQLG